MKTLSLLTLSLFLLCSCSPRSDVGGGKNDPSKLQAQTTPTQSVTGTWSWSGENESGGHLLTIHTKNKVQFQLNIMRGAPSYNTGFIEGEFNLNGNIGVFQSAEFGICEILFDFKKSKVVLTQPPEKGDCGFGFGVYPNGTYILTSPEMPKFAADDIG